MLLASTAICGCGNKSQQAEYGIEDSVLVDTVPTETVNVKEEVFSSPDLKIFFLHGHVKSVEEKWDGHKFVFNFNQRGDLVNAEMDEYQCSMLSRDKDEGKLMEIRISNEDSSSDDDFAGFGMRFEYGADEYPISETIFSYEYEAKTVYVFKADSEFPVSYRTDIEDSSLDEKKTVKTKITYDVFDEQGNWTKRTGENKYNKFVVTRKITYYE